MVERRCITGSTTRGDQAMREYIERRMQQPRICQRALDPQRDRPGAPAPWPTACSRIAGTRPVDRLVDLETITAEDIRASRVFSQ